MYAATRDYYSEMICILRKIHRLRKHPWISALTMDPQIAAQHIHDIDAQIIEF